MAFPALSPFTIRAATFGSVATNGSSYLPAVRAAAAGQVLDAWIVNGTTTSIVSGTTAGSAVTITLYKNASNAASIISSFNGSGTTVATLGSASLVTSSTANGRFAAGDLLIAEFTGGAANNASNAGCFVQVDLAYGHETGATPAAATGPAED